MNKQALKEDLVDLRMKLAEAENQAEEIVIKIPQDIEEIRGEYFVSDTWNLAHETYINIQEADENLCKLAKLLGLDKLDLVKPKELSNAK